MNNLMQIWSEPVKWNGKRTLNKYFCENDNLSTRGAALFRLAVGLDLLALSFLLRFQTKIVKDKNGN